MRMQVPSPHSFTQKRPVTTTDAYGRQVAATPETIEESIPGLMSPAGTSAFQGPFGTVEQADDMIFLEAVDDDGNTRHVRDGDLFIDEATNEVWQATGPGVTNPNPSLFAGQGVVNHHIQITVVRTDVETRNLG